MCMISKEVEEVTDTKLFAGTNPSKTRQLTVYANTVDNVSKNNAMVLPVPFPNSVIFHDLSDYKDFFTDCSSCFSSEYLYKSQSMSFTNNANSLHVYNVGSYKASIVPTIADFGRIDSSVFELSDGLKKTLQVHYSNPIFGFIVCKLDVGKEKYHPFAYSHTISNKMIFLPTRHYHVEKPKNNYFLNGNFVDLENLDHANYADYADYADDWSHEIYLYNTDVESNKKLISMSKSDKVWNKKSKINYDKLTFDLDTNCENFSKLVITGKNPNIDIVVGTC